MLDANLNRAREALRVLEDVARFALDSEPLAARLKPIRHAISRVPDTLADPSLLLLARDTPGDVGTTIKTSHESTRADLHAIASAAAKRLTEALRVIEETLKLDGISTDPLAPRSIEQARYEIYDIERELLISLAPLRAPQWRLCVLITESLCKLPWQRVAREAIAGGADCLQLREKSLDAADLLARARELVHIARTSSVHVIINDRPDIALLAGAHGVHLGQTDLPIAAVRTLAGNRLLIGISTHNLAEARAAVNAGADYCGVGAMFPTSTKPRDTSGPQYLRDYLADPHLSRIPHLAIGGITPANIANLRASGVRGVAVSSVICGANDPASVARAICSSLAEPAHV